MKNSLLIPCRNFVSLLAALFVCGSAFAQYTLTPYTSFGNATTPGWLPPGSSPYLSTANNERGFAYNPLTGNLVLPSRNGGNFVAILNGTTGEVIRTLDTTGVSGGTLALMGAGVSDDGAIYVSILQSGSTALSPYKVYKWDSENSTSAPTVAFSQVNPQVTNGAFRFGDAFAVRGNGTSARFISAGGSSGNSTMNGTLTPNNGNFMVGSLDGSNANTIYMSIPNTLTPSNDYRLGLTWVDDNTIIGSQGTSAKVTDFTLTSENRTTTNATVVGTVSTASADRPIGFSLLDGRSLLGTVNTTSSLISIYDISTSALLAYGNTTSGVLTPNANGNGNFQWGPVLSPTSQVLYAMSTNQGIQAMVFSLQATSDTIYWLGSNGTLWSAGSNWSTDASGTPTADFANGADIIFSATGSSNSSATDLGGDLTIGSLTIDTANPVGISGGNLTINGTTTAAITVNATAGNVTIAAPLILSGSSSTLSIENANTMLASIASSNGLVKTGNGTVEIQNRIWVSELGGNLEVQSGNFVSRDGLSLGIGASNETATISGNTTSFSSPTTLNVGYDGSGNTLAVESGATASAGSVWIGGTSPAANNSATVNGTGSSLTSAAGGSIAVGYAGSNNTLNISNGGSADSSAAYVGYESTASDNTATVTGANSTWTNSGTFHIGYNGTGNTLAIENGGRVQTATADVLIGFNAGSNHNAVTINGTGSHLTNNATLYVGRTGSDNSLSITNSGNLTTKNSRIGGDAASANNSATVSGAGSAWSNTGTMRIGSFGSNNSLTISNAGAVAAAGNSFLGYNASSTSNLLTVNGTSSSFTGSNLTVGLDGSSNTLSISNGGNVSLTGSLAIGYNAASASNTAQISGSGSTLSAQNIQIGAGSDNKLLVADSATVSTANIALAGTNATLQIGDGNAAGNLALTGAIVTTGTATGRSVVFNHSDSNHQFASTISGDLAVLHSGSGTTTLTANNTYTGDTTISAGTLSIGNGGTTGSIFGNVINSAALVFNRSDDTTFSGEISGIGSVVKLGNGTTAQTADNTYLGGTTISAGTLSIGNGSASGSLAGNVINNAALVFNRSDASTYSGSVTGNGTLEKLGAGALTLSGNSTYTGSTTLSGGSLSITGSINGTSSLTLNGGSALGITGTLTANGAVNANSGTITIGQGGSFKAVGSVVGEQPKEYLFVANYGTQPDLTNPSVSVFDLQTKTLNRTIGSSQNLNFPGGLALDSSGSLYVANYMSNSVSIFSNGTYTGNITNLFGPGGLAFNPDGKLYVANSNSTSVSIFSNGNPTTPITSNLFKPYDLAFSPSGNLYVAEPFENKITIFSSNNSYTGDIPVIGANFIAFSSNGTLYAVNTEGTKISAFANNTFVSDLPITTTGTFYGLTFDANDNLYVAESRFDSNDPYKSRIRIFSNGVSTGEITSNLASPGFLTVGSLSSATSIPVGITLAESASDNATLNIGTYGGSDTNATLTTPYIAFGNGTAVLNLNLASNFTLSAALTGGGANSTINQLGNGTTTLTSTNSTFTGAININSGTLAFTGSLANANTHVNSGGTLAGIVTLGNVTINSGGAIAPGNSPGTITVGSLTLNGGSFYNWQTSSINGTAGTNWDLISSTGTLTLNASSGNPITIDVSSLGDATLADVKKASWEIGNFSAGINGFDKNAFLFNPASMTGNAGSYFMSLGTGNLTLLLNYKTGAVWNTASGNWSTASQWEGSLLPENDDAIEFSGPGGISANDGYLTSVSGLTFTSTTNGSYSVGGSDLAIDSEGILNDSSSTQTVGINLALGADQTFAANTANLVVSGNITGGYSLTKEGNQTLTLSGANTYTGDTIINAGTLAIAAGGSLNGTPKILVGNSTSGNTLSILGSVSTDSLTLSQQVGSDGNTATVGGGSSPASLTVSNLLNIGFGGMGNTLNILANGTATAGATEIGGYGANNTANVNGGALNSTGYLVVGYYSDGNALNITAGGNATVGSITVGRDAADGNNTASSNNTILVGGPGSTLQTTGVVYIGQNGSSNKLSVQNGGVASFTSNDTVLGLNAGSNGNTLSINGSGSQFTNNGTFYVGKGGSENTLLVQGGGALATKNSRIGHEATSSNNTATVSGTGSSWTNTGTLRVGNIDSNGNTLAVISGANVTISGNTFIGHGAASSNNLLSVDGAGTAFNGASLTVGFDGSSNSLSIANGGNMSLSGSLAIGNNTASANNAAFVSGQGSVLSAQNIQIGNGADNKLTISDSGLVSTANIALAGTNATLQIGNGTSAGNLTLTGSILTIGNATGRSVVFNHIDSTYEFGSILSGDLALSQVGTGTTTLTANNTYTGGTIISAGTLALGGTQGLVNGTISVGYSATFSVNRTNEFTLGNIISGAGSFAQIGSNKTSITATNTYAGGTTISSGTLWTQNSQALGTGNTLLNGGTLLVTSSQESIMGNQTLSINGSLDWISGKIAFYDTGTSPLSGNLTINVGGDFSASAGNKTFDFSGVEALDSGNYTLVSTAGLVDADGVNFVAVHGPYTQLFGNFTTTNKTVFYTVTGAVSGGTDIQNNGGPNTPVVANYQVTGPTVTIGADNKVSALTFTNSAPLAIQSNGELTVTSGTLAVQTGASVVSGGTLNTLGNLDKTGTGELDLQSNTNVNGIANVVQGLLSVNGQLNANSVLVDPTATLGGAGVIVASNVIVNGNLSPGNSPGTLNVAGNLVLTGADSTIIEIASPTNFDRIVVSGTATLGGTLNAVAYGGGTITPGARYDFLQAGSIVGEFDSLIAPDGLRIRFLNSGTVGSLLFGPASFVPYALNQNQRNLAKALDTFVLATEGDAIIVGTALDSLTADQFPAAFDQIMPGFYESLANIAIEQTFNQTQLLNQRISSVRLGAAGFQAMGGISQPLMHDKDGKSAAQAKDATPIVQNAMATNWNSWALGTGMFSRTTNLGRLQNYNNDAGGFLVGADYRWSENFVTGLYGGYDYSYAEYNGGGSTRGNSVSFGTYASYANEAGYYADAVIGGGYTGFQTSRSIKFGTIDRTASADPNSGQFTAGINLGKDFEIGKFTLGPIVGAQYTYAGIGGFTESGAESLDLSLGQQNANSLRSTLGGRVAYTWNLNQKIALIPEVRMFWQHEFLNNARNIGASLNGGNGPSFDYETTDPYRDSVFAGAGVTAQFGERWNASVFYNVNFGSQTYQNNIISTSLGFSF